jgi:hypothetical protein
MMFSVPESYAIEKSRCRVESFLSDKYADPMKLRGGTWFEPLLSMAVSKNIYYLNLPRPPSLLQSTPCPEIPYFIVLTQIRQLLRENRRKNSRSYPSSSRGQFSRPRQTDGQTSEIIYMIDVLW